MRRIFVALLSALVLSSLAIPATAQVSGPRPVDYVDPMIGTLGGGFSFPGPAAPFGMVQLSPDTEGYFAYTGYQYADTSIRGFSHHHIQAMGVRSNGDLPFMPSVGAVTSSDPRSWMSPFDHANEEAEAGYYRVLLQRGGIEAELAAGTRIGMHRYTFPPTREANVILDVGRSNVGWSPLPRLHPQQPEADRSGHQASLEIRPDGLVTGTANTPQGYDIHFAARFDRPIAGFGAWDTKGQTPTAGKASASGAGAGGYVTFDTTADGTVGVEVGISFVSRANALQNLDAELAELRAWNEARSAPSDHLFDALVAKTKAEWNQALSTIVVDGGTDSEKTSFYTALYHAQHHPNVYQDVNGEYVGHDDRVHVATDHVHYANFSLWDTYRGQSQLLATIQPDRYRDMMLSLLDIYREAGRFPQWAMNDALPDYMEGDPIQPTIVDGYCRGALPEEYVDEMYAALRSQAWDEPMATGVGKRSASESGYREYHDRGYMSGRGSDASGNFEYAIADFALAVMADSLGHAADRDELLSRADNYKELINPATGFAHPRNADGTWMAGYHPEAPDYWKEGTGWQYTWLAPHDVRGLFDIVAGGNDPRDLGSRGDDLVSNRLDTYFSTALSDVPGAMAELQKLITVYGVAYAGNQHAPSNEHDVHAPYLYDYIGQPWKTQKIMRGYQMLFRPTPDGLPGNDDLGSMSAWYVWSALGFYPMTAGAPLYVVGSPLFSGATIAPAGGGAAIAVSAPDASLANRYIQSAVLGSGSGRTALERTWFTHDELLDAGAIEFRMGPVANEDWATTPAAAPPSVKTHTVSDFGCPRLEREEPQPIPTTLTYVGETTARGEQVVLAARLTDEAGGPVAGKTLSFQIAGQAATATTDGGGVATATVHVPDHGRSQLVAVSFSGDATHLPSQVQATITWGRGR